MAARKYLTAAQIKLINAYEAAGGSAWVRRHRDGKITVSLNGHRDVPLADAIARLAA